MVKHSKTKHMATYQKFRFTGELTAAQYLFFQKHGFIHFENFISKEGVDEILDSVKTVQNDWVEKDLKLVNGIPIKYGKDVDGSTIVHRFAFTSQFSPAIHNFASQPSLTTLLDLMPEGARIALDEKDGVVFNHYVNVDGSNFFEMGWHTDSARDIFYGKKVNPMLNVGLYLDDSPVSKGGLRILPGSHKQGILKTLFKKKYFVDHQPDENEVAVEAKAGDLVIHDGRIWHRVAAAEVKGEASRRRVMYIPVIVGKYQPKDKNSKMPIYHKFSHLIGDRRKTAILKKQKAA